jgi:hypothetical protein
MLTPSQEAEPGRRRRSGNSSTGCRPATDTATPSDPAGLAGERRGTLSLHSGRNDPRPTAPAVAIAVNTGPETTPTTPSTPT